MAHRGRRAMVVLAVPMARPEGDKRWRSMVGATQRRQRCGEVGHLASLAINSSGEGLLEDEGIELDRFPDLDSDEEGWWWQPTVSTMSGRGAEQTAVRGGVGRHNAN
jgi:hypothetical protein